MNTKNMTQEQISAFADGELPEAQLDGALTALREAGGRTTWDVYHHIGDVLRSDDMAFRMSPDFTARLAMRLDEEPTFIGSVKHPQMDQQGSSETNRSATGSTKRFWLRGMAAAAAVATLAFVATPQLMVASKVAPTNSTSSMLASASSQSDSGLSSTRVVAQEQSEVLRDPGIDEYLLAHQRFSPSVYSTAQYARSATFAIDSDK